MTISIAPLLKRQNPSPAYGHGWIMGENGHRWHPSNNQKALLHDLSSAKPTLLARIKRRMGG
ncbi:phage filamentation protein Fil family protein [Winslowiella arboricola]